ncbi:MAG: hypothetical protein CMJ58_20855 [Planctomycetaceae bacterium]|nr:hypothetical protein [Planctomycetaceae bacterium]
MNPSCRQPDEREQALLDEAVGYLNFSSGTSDPRFLNRLSELWRALETDAADTPAVDPFMAWLTATIDRLEHGGGAFADVTQARTVAAALPEVLAGYRAFHRDLLHHQTDADLWRPFFVGRVCEALLTGGGPAGDSQQIVDSAIQRLNDFVGYRPVPQLTGDTRAEPYPHEYVRPIPLFIAGAGVAAGRYEKLLSRALEILRDADPEILQRAWFDLDRLEEIALDPRAYDFDHPANRRPNYHFGMWDPFQISESGYYTRFVLQQVTLDALLKRCDGEGPDRLEEAAAVLAGTVLMASGTSGDGPGRHDSETTLSTLLPHIAAYRDDFYQSQLEKTPGEPGERLRAEAQKRRQPFGGARQHLNHELARRRALQLQRVHLALLFARMGRRDSALRQANAVRVASARMLTAIYCHLTSGHDALDRHDPHAAAENLQAIDELLHRGIECGALVDPWNVVGFAANFSLFPALENTVHDWRVDELIELVEQILDLCARAWSEAAVVDDSALEKKFESILGRLAAWWDQYATASVENVPRLVAKEIEVSSNLVAGALNAWHKSGAAAGDVGFWALFVEQFDSSKAFQLVIEALFDHGDIVASRALLMQWVHQRYRTPLDDGEVSWHPLALRWLAVVEHRQADEGTDHWDDVAKFFDFLEANAEEYWRAPTELFANDGPTVDVDDIPFDDPVDDDDDGEYDPDSDGYESDYYEYDESDDSEFEYGEDEEEDELFGAAYEQMVYRDSTDDGIEGDLAEGGYDPLHSEWEYEADRLEQRLDFLNTIARLWKHTAITWAGGGEAPERRALLDHWLRQAATNHRGLIELLEDVRQHKFAPPSGSHESLVEFDRLRTIKEALVQKIIATCVETAAAARLLMTTRSDAAIPAAEFGEPIDAVSVELMRAVLTGDPDAARQVWKPFLDSMRPRQLLYIPYSRGGEPRKIVIARGVQRLLHDLLCWLPKLGLLRETCELLDLAQDLESANPVGQGAVTEFDRLFETGYQAVVRALVAAAEEWDERLTAEQSDQMLVDALQLVTERQLQRWLAHSKTLRLSVVEKLADAGEWQRFMQFVTAYGADLFTQKFLSLGNLRGILHQGVEPWLDRLLRDEEHVENHRFLAAIDKQIPKQTAVDLLTLAIEAVVENYRTYRDYNTTTTQSDHGEMLHALVDFLRLRAEYDRVAWNLKPVVWAHEILVRHDRHLAAEMWRRAFAERTADVAEDHVNRLADLSSEYGMQLATVSDRLSERFTRPAIIDRVRAMVGPAMDRTCPDSDAAFATLEREITELASQPHGAGLDVPDWLTALEDEVTEARSRLTHVSSADRLARRIGQVRLSWEEINRQLDG